MTQINFSYWRFAPVFLVFVACNYYVEKHKPNTQAEVPNSKGDLVEYSDLKSIFMTNCISCHLSTGQDPLGVFKPTGFANEAKAAEILKRTSSEVSDEGHMPPDKLLSKSSIEEISKWVHSLGSNQSATTPENKVDNSADIDKVKDDSKSTEVSDHSALKHIFAKNCVRCHLEEGRDPLGVFLSNGFANKQMAAEVIKRVSSDMTADGHMPPNLRLPQASIEKLKVWSQKISNEVSAVPVCTWLTRVPATRSNAFISQKQGFDILRDSCASCHGKFGELGDRDIAALSILGLSASGWLANNIFAKKDPPDDEDECRQTFRDYFVEKIMSPRTYLKTIAIGSGVYAAFHQGIKTVHTQFLNKDGSLNVESIANGTESIDRILLEVNGIDGRGFMPPSKLPDWYVGHYSIKEKMALTSFLRRLIAKSLPSPCQLLPLRSRETNSSRMMETTFSEAADRCDSLAMYIPTIDQLKLSEDIIGRYAKQPGCYWSSSFSNDETLPRLVLDVSQDEKTFQVKSVDSDEKCFGLCLNSDNEP